MGVLYLFLLLLCIYVVVMMQVQYCVCYVLYYVGGDVGFGYVYYWQVWGQGGYVELVDVGFD